MLRCSDGSYYVGSTTNLELRLAQHQTGDGAAYTRRRRPVKLVWFEEFSRVDQAFAREKQVQGWSHRKREALITGDHHALPTLSKGPAAGAPGRVSTSSTTELKWGLEVHGGVRGCGCPFDPAWPGSLGCHRWNFCACYP
ncbi:GIY-YIG nuclease family protein [Arthrobacter nitrophenolicus]|nr:GIY-YIG nuclease family protein [Arthrobacter nitrophenolicus]